MNEQLSKIIELSKIDEEIDNFLPQEEKLKENLTKLKDKQNEISQKIVSLEDEIRDCRYQKNKNEILLKDLSVKITDISKKSSVVKTEREIKSLQIEEEIAKEQIAFANEEIERLDKNEESKKTRIEELKSSLDTYKKDIDELEGSLSKELKELEGKKKTVYTRREKLTFEINPKVFSFYQKIRRWASNTTVVPIKKRSCMGCYIVISDNVYRNVIKSEEIVTCANCGRILFLESVEDNQEIPDAAVLAATDGDE